MCTEARPYRVEHYDGGCQHDEEAREVIVVFDDRAPGIPRAVT
jgi:hypothetical protein